MTDLTKITTVFGELPKETREALKALPIGQVQVRGHLEWVADSCPSWFGANTYRQKPVRSFAEALFDLPNGTILRIGGRRFVKYTDIEMHAVLRQLEAPHEYCWYRDSAAECRRVGDMEGFTPSEWTADDITIEYVPEARAV